MKQRFLMIVLLLCVGDAKAMRLLSALFEGGGGRRTDGERSSLIAPFLRAVQGRSSRRASAFSVGSESTGCSDGAFDRDTPLVGGHYGASAMRSDSREYIIEEKKSSVLKRLCCFCRE